jgi:hypothetical protein
VFLARRFRAGRQLEGSIEASFQALEQRAAQLAQKQPDPAMLKAQADDKRLAMEGDFKARELALREQEFRLKAGLQAQEIGLREAEMAQSRKDALMPDREAMVSEREAMINESEAKMRELAAALAAVGQRLEAMQQQQASTSQAQAQALAQLAASMTAPKRVVRGPDGRAMGVETVLN